ncbi:MAG: pyridoxal-phosphate dependent enzyme [Anaerolineae bacterium]|uniref:pyridoxal-phosphate dependent enzyme n=1 Tax=Promineifilum sp. TaxID=2664178 RepID=UPI001DFF8B94|nr:pyridoxal-phosphate dependent enzyme [Anaerolineales bacterium]MCB8934684.1 pyridoxal-phosphate dependent enzyme [Promineifilum sp.]MCO5180958.1 pyridoxal-phosphate dependent enzyme [Promineifilum sp.]MCW5846680.1 pyridoxal-phosphate dependent enzyme [Anaerolineae bacterium]
MNTLTYESTQSLARGQRSLGDPSLSYPLFPPLVEGCPVTSTADLQYPLVIDYDYSNVPAGFFKRSPFAGIWRWGELLPPLAPGLSMGEGGTPLVAAPRLAGWAGTGVEVYIKDESRNPTGSHKDRLNLCTVSSAVLSGAPGITVASSGNHGAAAAAYAARAGLPCVLFITEGTEPHLIRMVSAYGAAIVPLPRPLRRVLMRELVHRAGYMPASSITATHTGHPFGPEGYKTIAYELYQQLGGRVPAAVFVPTAYAELLYGVWLGFKDMQRVAGIGPLPQMIACEPAAGAPLRAALSAGRPVVKVDEAPTAAYSIVVGSNSYRGVLAVRESEGEALALTDEEITTAQMALGREGLWAEFSSAASLAGLRQAAARRMRFDGPVVCLMTSTGFKDQGIPAPELPPVAPTWEAVQGILQQVYGLTV